MKDWFFFVNLFLKMSSMHSFDDFDKIVEEQFPKEHCEASSTGIVKITLPEEVWILIWSNLDFNIVQKICSCVSKSWLKMIRSSKLSWEMKLQIIDYKDVMDVNALRDFNSILFH